MKSKKEEILDLFNIVPVLSRDQIISCFFTDNTQPQRLCSKYMRELHREKKIKMEKRIKPFVCFKKGWKGSTFTGKLWHHLAVADIYFKLRPKTFIWEPDMGEATPDAYIELETRFLNEVKVKPFFIEYQAPGSNWSAREMAKKMQRYEKAYRKKKWEKYSPVPPVLWIVSEKEYKLPDVNFKWILKSI